MSLDTLETPQTHTSSIFGIYHEIFAQGVQSTLSYWESLFCHSQELLEIWREMLQQHKNPLSYISTQGEYQTFMSSQKARKLVFETALKQLQLLKGKEKYINPELQRLENYIRTNLAFTFTFERPDYNVSCQKEEEICETERMRLMKFSPIEISQDNAYLLIAPISGHFPTLLRKTIQALLDEGYEVYITDWKSPLEINQNTLTGLDAYTQDISDTYDIVSHDTQSFDVLAVCQPGPITLSSLALSESQGKEVPRSVTLMASPIDTSVNPTQVGKVGESLSPMMLHQAQLTSPKSGKQVYPGTYQISNFISANLERHLKKFTSLAFKSTPLDIEEEKTLAFYHEYFAVMDIPFDFFQETIQKVFQTREWKSGKVRFGDGLLDINNIQTPLCIIEGEKDDICGIGETHAALGITEQTETLENYLCVPDTGHYGVFAGKAFRKQVIPHMSRFQQSLS
ncbi:hypothetical protein LAT59_00115 [Candidatus Gracilibacteria bacterium]|nr:hypothetical protein [Candidatus Gracilibacteria bacterium]